MVDSSQAMTGASQIETPLLKVPFESLKKAARDRKSLVDEATRALSGINSLAEEEELIQESVASSLGNLVDKLNTLKRKLDEVSINEKEGAERSQARLKYLSEIGDPREGGVVHWNTQRMDRILADYFLRNGCEETAATIIQESDLENLVDVNVFRDAKSIIEGLKKRDCSEALAWCLENRSRLKRFRSKLEFKLHLQVFIELVRRDELMNAINYARENLAQWAHQQMAELQRVLVTLAFRANTTCERYKELFAENRWDMIVRDFYEALYRLNHLTSESLINIHLQAGLSALKTAQSYEDGCSQEDPLHLMSFQQIAEGLPFAKYDRSRLICSVTKEAINADNPPKALPNGYVYSTKAIAQMKDGTGKVICPCTGDICEESDVRRVFIV